MTSALHPNSDPAGPSAHTTELDLIKRVLDGEVDLFYTLFHPCERTMFFKALSVLGNRADAEDVVQEAALKAFKSLAGFRHEAKFSTWLIQITVNESRATLRRNRRQSVQSIETRVGSEDQCNNAFDVPDCRATPSEIFLRQELSEVLIEALNSLPPTYEAVLNMRDIEGLNTEETAQVLGLTEANVRTRLSRARLQMKHAVKRVLCSSC